MVIKSDKWSNSRWKRPQALNIWLTRGILDNKGGSLGSLESHQKSSFTFPINEVRQVTSYPFNVITLWFRMWNNKIASHLGFQEVYTSEDL